MTSAAQTHGPPHKGSRLLATVKALLRTRVTTGLIVVLPIWITILLVQFVFELMRDASQWVVYGFLRGDWLAALPEAYRPAFKAWSDEQLRRPGFQWGIGIVSVLFTILILYAIGLLAANVVGRRMIDAGERLVDRVPLIKTVYRAAKQIIASLAGHEEQRRFRRMVLVPYPSEKARSLGFITAVRRDIISGAELYVVFIPTPPNPATGCVVVVRRSECVELDWNLEESLRVVMSGGILMPERVTLEVASQAPPAAEPPALPGAGGEALTGDSGVVAASASPTAARQGVRPGGAARRAE